MTKKLIGFGGVATAGKDSALEALRLFRPELKFKRYAFADPLKAELEEIVFANFGFNIWKLTPEQKAVIRPLLVGWGAGKRYIHEDYWLNKIMAEIDHDNSREIPVITDVRYGNEAAEIKNRDGIVVHITRILPDGNQLPPANEEERINDKIVKALADIKIIWETKLDVNNHSVLVPYLGQLSSYI